MAMQRRQDLEIFTYTSFTKILMDYVAQSSMKRMTVSMYHFSEENVAH